MSLELSGDRLVVTYRLACPHGEAQRRAKEICIEQTVEFPADLVSDPDIREQIFGRVEDVRKAGDGIHEADISYAVEAAGAGLTQFLNLLFGNISLLPGIRLERFDLPERFLSRFSGPRFGREGLRRLLGAPDRPLLCTALKPMGLAPEALAAMAYRYATGGIDIIKDDHGLADQPFCPFEERVGRCAAEVARANEETGGRTLYAPNVTAGPHELFRRARAAKAAGAGALLVSPGLTGFDALGELAADDAVGLPIISHPSLLGSFVVSPDHGISHFALFGQVNRLAGADAVIFPHAGGRFSFSSAECRGLAVGTGESLGKLQAIFPVPAGGMSLARVPELLDFYGDDVVLLIGGDLHRSDDLVARCREFRLLVEK